MKFIKKYWKIVFLLGLVVLVTSGCVRVDSSGKPTGMIYEYIGIPTANLMDYIAKLFGGSYGIAIMIITLFTRIFMIPTTYKMTKSSMESSAKMKYAQPEISEIQAEIAETDDPQEKIALQQELMQVHSKYDINMLSNMGGCLPLLIQMPIMSAVFAAIRSSEQIAESSFLGINLGQKSIIIVIFVSVVSFLSGWLMQKASPVSASDNPQAGQMQKSMLIMNPLMMGWFAYASNAGLGIYLLTGAVLTLVQQAYMNYVARPKIQAEIDEKMKKYENMPRQKRQKKARQLKQELKKANQDRIVPIKTTQGQTAGKRNAGKQKRR